MPHLEVVQLELEILLGDDIDVGGEFVSNLVPNTDNTYDIGITTQRWRDGKFSGLVTTTNLFVSGSINFSWR